MLCRELRKKYPKNRSGCIASVVKKNWDSKGITVPLAGGLEYRVLHGFARRMLYLKISGNVSTVQI